MTLAEADIMDSTNQNRRNETEHPEDSLAAFALGALRDDEREVVLAHLVSCSSCQEKVARYREVSEVLPLAEPPESPSPQLRERILQRAAQTPQPRARSRPVTLVAPPRRRAFWRSNPVAWLVAAAMFAVSLGMGAWNYALQQQVQTLQQAASSATVALAATPNAPAARGQLVIGSRGQSVLVVGALPPPSPGQVYEAWLIGSAGPLPAGTFTTTPDGHGALVLSRPPRAGQVVAVTNEPAPGGEKPSGKVLLKGTV